MHSIRQHLKTHLCTVFNQYSCLTFSKKLKVFSVRIYVNLYTRQAGNFCGFGFLIEILLRFRLEIWPNKLPAKISILKIALQRDTCNFKPYPRLMECIIEMSFGKSFVKLKKKARKVKVHENRCFDFLSKQNIKAPLF